MIGSLMFSLAIALAAQAKEKDDDAAGRLAYMKESVLPYKLQSTLPDATPFRLQADPLFRLKNDVSGVKDGAIFLWADEIGRPAAAIQVFLVPSGLWIHEFTSLSTAGFSAKVGRRTPWQPSIPGVDFKVVPDAPKHAATAEQRLRQMRAIADDFSAEDDFETKGWNTLRLLAKPLNRYGKSGSAVEDGTLFAFVLGTDPEVFLMVESRLGKNGPEWQYAFAPMTCYPVKASWKGKADWSLPLRLPADDPSGTFYDTQYSSTGK